MKPLIKVAFASGTDDLNRGLIDRVADLYPELPLYVVSEFPPHRGEWVRYRVNRGLRENLARCRAAFQGKRLRLAGVMLVPGVPYRRMRLMALLLSPRGFLAYNEAFGSFMLRPRCLPTILRHTLWRARNFLRWQLRPGGHLYTWAWRCRHPREWRAPLAYALARLALRPALCAGEVREQEAGPPGISVVVPSRSGRHLLETLLPGVVRERPDEIIVVDNGSGDGTAQWLAREYPGVIVEHSAAPLSFARAANRGIARARHSHICLLNNDMVIEPGFFAALGRAFGDVPDLFAATAQILFPPGTRREETGKAVMRKTGPRDFPIRCDDPLPGEDLSWVLYGSGGCSLYHAGKLRALGGFNEAYEPAYVEDLDIGYRAWQQGWPTVFVAGARVEHRHRATTSRYYRAEELETVLELNYLRFLAGAVASRRLFRKLWREAVLRLRLLGNNGPLAAAWRIAFEAERLPRPRRPEESFLALASGDVAVFPGRARRGKPVVLLASPYVPFPLSHGAAVRIYNLMRRAAADFDQVLVAFSETLETPAPELLEIAGEVVVVRRTGTHAVAPSRDPDTVEEFRSPAYRAALRQTVRKWRPAVAQLEFTQMAQYAEDCAPARTILVEHDITFELYEQMMRLGGDWETRRQLERWRRFEPAAWRRVDRVVAMSTHDAALVEGAAATVLPNGVDLERFQPSAGPPSPRRLLFIGSFAHKPNVLAMEFFLGEVWPLLHDCTLHVIAGKRHLDFAPRALFERPGIELEGFVADVRPAYRNAAVVIAPLLASAGTNIKILEAMAMGKAIVTTPAGIHGLDVESGVVVAREPAAFAAAIEELLGGEALREETGRRARLRVEREFNWDLIAARQARLYRELQPTILKS
ncbi:MAG: glycosyltransferase [Bryobacteraceae bacterium]